MVTHNGRLIVVTEDKRNNLRRAQYGPWRLISYWEGGSSLERFVEGIGWCLLVDYHALPPGLERSLEQALDLPSY